MYQKAFSDVLEGVALKTLSGACVPPFSDALGASAKSVNSFLPLLIFGICTTWCELNEIFHSWQRLCCSLGLLLCSGIL